MDPLLTRRDMNRLSSYKWDHRWPNLGYLKIPPHETKIYGRQSVNISAIYTWNYLQSHHRNIMFHQLSLTRLKKLIMQYYFPNYNEQPFIMYIHFCFFFICSFSIIKQINSTFYLWKFKILSDSSFILAQLFGNCSPFIKRVSFFYLAYMHFFFGFHATVFSGLILRLYKFAIWCPIFSMSFTGMQRHGFF